MGRENGTLNTKIPFNCPGKLASSLYVCWVLNWPNRLYLVFTGDVIDRVQYTFCLEVNFEQIPRIDALVSQSPK